jgi:bifunctional UDP-N-acetylglucosamine pyrophosphorylase/glucosamine-1-phosphate N-acetyltransferase
LTHIVEAADADDAARRETLCNAGLMAIDGAALPDLLAGIGCDNAKGEYYLTDAVAGARRMGRQAAVVEGAAEELLGINTRADQAAAEAAMQQRLRAQAMAAGATLVDPPSTFLAADTALGRDVEVGPHVVFGPGVVVQAGAVIHPFCHLTGVVVGPDCSLGPFARIRPGTRLGAGVHIGNFVELKNTRIGDASKANHLSYLGDGDIGEGANIGAGTIFCNYDGFLKHTTTVADGAFIGSNASLVAPVRVGRNANIGAGSVITRDVADEALAVARGRQVERGGWAVTYRAMKAAEKADRQGRK